MQEFDTSKTRKVQTRQNLKQSPTSFDEQRKQFSEKGVKLMLYIENQEPKREEINIISQNNNSVKNSQKNQLHKNIKEGKIQPQDDKNYGPGISLKSSHKSLDDINIQHHAMITESSQEQFYSDEQNQLLALHLINSPIGFYNIEEVKEPDLFCSQKSQYSQQCSGVFEQEINQNTRNDQNQFKPRAEQDLSSLKSQKTNDQRLKALKQKSKPKCYPFKNIERSLFRYLQYYISDKGREMKMMKEFKYFLRLEPKLVGKKKLILLIQKNKTILKLSLEFLEQNLWEEKAKRIKKEQLKICNKKYYNLLKKLINQQSFG